MRGVSPQNFVQDGDEYEGVEIALDQLGWPVVFAERARLAELPHLLAGRAGGFVQPVWDDDEVTAWTVADVLGNTSRVPGWRQAQ